MVLFGPSSERSVSPVWKQFSCSNIFRHRPNYCFALNLKIGPAIFHLLTRKKQMKNRLAKKIKITGDSIWLNRSQFIKPKQPRTTKFIKQSHGRLLFSQVFWLALLEMGKRSPQLLDLNMRNLAFGSAMSALLNLQFPCPERGLINSGT